VLTVQMRSQLKCGSSEVEEDRNLFHRGLANGKQTPMRGHTHTKGHIVSHPHILIFMLPSQGPCPTRTQREPRGIGSFLHDRKTQFIIITPSHLRPHLLSPLSLYFLTPPPSTRSALSPFLSPATTHPFTRSLLPSLPLLTSLPPKNIVCMAGANMLGHPSCEPVEWQDPPLCEAHKTSQPPLKT
ncbi:hypothetical protein JOQ06_028381, partial [Pogonophryne albipinna]